MKFKIVVFLFICHLSSGQWTAIGPKYSSSFRSMSFSANGNLYLGGSNGYCVIYDVNAKTFKKIENETWTKYDFRGLAITKNNNIWLMSAGEAEKGQSVIFKSTDEGQHFTKVLELSTKGVFFDCIKFKNNNVGYLLSDAIDKKAVIFKTKNAGKTWNQVTNVPDMLGGEASYAASNSSILLRKKQVWFCTQNRIFHSKNNAKTWKVYDTPFENETMMGIYGLTFNSKNELLATGGEYNNKKESIQFGISNKIGNKWNINGNGIGMKVIECAAKINETRLIAVGTAGTFFSKDNGQNWGKIADNVFHVVNCDAQNCYAAGSGQVFKWEISDLINR